MNLEARSRAGAGRTARPSGRPRAFGVDPVVIAAAVLAAFGAYHIKTCVLLIRSGSGNIAGEEMSVVWGLERLLLGGALYTDPAGPPYGVIQYAPVYYRVCAGVAWLAGVREGDTAGVTALARSVSLACLLGQVLVAGVVLRRHLGAGWDLVVSAGVFLLIVQGVWGVTARPDTMAVMVSAVAMLAALESVRAARGYRRGGATAWLSAAVAAVVLAGLVKQNAVEAGLYALPPAAVVLGRRRASWACLAAAAPAAFLSAAAFRGLGTADAVRANLIGGLNNGVNPVAALHLAYVPYLKVMAAVVAAGLLAALEPWSRLVRRAGGEDVAAEPAELIVGWATLASLGFAVLTALKFGSAPNYFLLFNLFAVVSIARFVETRRGPWAFLFALYLVLFLPVRAFEARVNSSALGDRYSACDEVARRLRDELDDDPEGTLFFSTDPRLDVLLPDRCAVPQKLVAEIMYRRGVVDYSDFARAVADGRVRYCVTFTPRGPSQDLASALRQFGVAQYGVDPGPGRATFLGASFDRFRPLFRVGAFTVHEAPDWGRPPAFER